MWKLKFWLVIARIYNRLADITLDISRFFNERCEHGTEKYKECRSKYSESQKNQHEYLK